MSYREHVKAVAAKTGKVVSALTRVMPNVGGPAASKRSAGKRFALDNVVCHPNMKLSTSDKKVLASVQRKYAIRTCSAFGTISVGAALVLANVLQTDKI